MIASTPQETRTRRALGFIAALFVVAAAAAMSLADGAPDALRVIGSRVAGVVRSIGEPFGLGGFGRAYLPTQDLDQLSHLVGWGAVTLATAVLLPKVALRFLGPALLLISTALEPLQTVLSQTRAYDPADLKSNVVGIGLGLAAAAIWRFSLAARHRVSRPASGSQQL